MRKGRTVAKRAARSGLSGVITPDGNGSGKPGEIQIVAGPRKTRDVEVCIKPGFFTYKPSGRTLEVLHGITLKGPPGKFPQQLAKIIAGGQAAVFV